MIRRPARSSGTPLMRDGGCAYVDPARSGLRNATVEIAMNPNIAYPQKMNEQELPFSKLGSDQQKQLAVFYKESLELDFKESRNSAWELAKVLLGVNSGAAAGLFVLVRSSTEKAGLAGAFYTFCLGVFFVVAAYFVGAVQFAGGALKWEEDIQKVFQDQLSPSALISRRRQRLRGSWSKVVGLLGFLSFGCIIIGSLLAAKSSMSLPTRELGNAAPMIQIENTSTSSVPLVQPATTNRSK